MISINMNIIVKQLNSAPKEAFIPPVVVLAVLTHASRAPDPSPAAQVSPLLAAVCALPTITSFASTVILTASPVPLPATDNVAPDPMHVLDSPAKSVAMDLAAMASELVSWLLCNWS